MLVTYYKHPGFSPILLLKPMMISADAEDSFSFDIFIAIPQRW
jgi:hypothetical protein